MSQRRGFDLAIIGAGITGLSIAYHLARRGVSRILVLDRGGIGSGASGIAPGGVRRQWSTAVNCAMSEDSFRFYREVNGLLEPETPLIFRACGYVFLAHSAAMLDALGANVALQGEFDIPSRMVTAAELDGIVPGLRTDTVIGASYCAEDGYFDDPWGVVFAFARAARRLGARIDIAPVTGLLPRTSGWDVLTGEEGSVEAAGVVVAAGADSAQLLRPLGIELPIAAEPRYLHFSNPVPERICDPLVISEERRFAVKQLADGQFLASYLGAGRDGGGERPEAWRAQIAEAADELLPALLNLSLTHLVKGFYDMTPDHQPILGAAPGTDGLWIAAGLSGHGFMMAPAVGRALADLITGEEPPAYLASFSPDRFAAQTLQTESQVI